MIDEEGCLQHTLQLFAAGYREETWPDVLSDAALHERREYFERHIRSRRLSQLSWRPIPVNWTEVAAFLHPPGSPYCFYTGNALVTSTGRFQNQPHLRDTVRCMRFSPHQGKEDVTVTYWTRKFDEPFSSIGVDSGHNVLVLVRDHFYNDVDTMIDGIRCVRDFRRCVAFFVALRSC